jgi:N-acetylmuramoyl-L-alanine amidase
MRIVLNAGHTVAGAGTGAIGYMIESIEARKIVNAVKRYLEMHKNEVILANVDTATSTSEYLRKTAYRANLSGCDRFVSIHFNAGGGKGCECYTWRGKKTPSAVGVCDELSKLGLVNRGVKDGSNLYVIKKTKAEAILIEVCFVDNRNDYELYKKLGVNRIAQAITRGILK